MSDVPHELCVAPMMERTDRHCRHLLRLLAPNVWLYTEMITAKALVNGDRERLLKFAAIEHPVALQLGGADPGELAAAAAWGVAAGYDEINLNVGCPSGRVQAGCFGAALMREPALVADCVAAMRARVHVPITVKTRIGVDHDDSYELLHAFARGVIDAGCATLIVHARKAWLSGLSPKENREIPPLEYARVHRLKRDLPNVEIVINGGFTDVAAVEAERGRVDGVMLGRAAYDRPMLIAELDHRRWSGSASPGLEQVRARALRAFVRYVDAELASGTSLKAMTRHLMGLYAHERGGRVWRRALSALGDGAAGLRGLRALVDARVADSCIERDDLDTMASPQLQYS